MGLNVSFDPQEYQDEVDRLSAAADEVTDTFDVSAARDKLTELCRTSLDFLASIILLEIFAYGYPKLFHAIWQMLCDAALQGKGKPKYAIGIPRGFSKTIILKLYVVWLVLFSERQFILIICNTATHANNFIADVADMLDNNTLVKLFGNWRAGIDKLTGIDRQDLKKFSFRGRNIIIAAMGTGGSPRGLNIKFVRPDVIIMDDMQNRDEAKNPEIAAEQLTWMLGTLMMACHPQRCVFIFVGNMYPFEGSILRKLKKSPQWISFITGALYADGTSIWPEHRDVDDLLAEFKSFEENGQPEIFHAEVMNDEEGGTVSGIDTSKIPLCPETLQVKDAQGGAIIIDPSGKKNTSDDTAIGAMLVFDGIPVLWDSLTKRLDPYETIQQATFMCVRYNMQLICVEGVAYQSTLCFWFEKVFKDLGIEGINIGELQTGQMAKNARIRAWTKRLLNGSNLLGPEVRSAVIYQLTQWDPLKTKNVDDLLDVGAYMDDVCAKFAPNIPLLLHAAMEEEQEGSHTRDLELAF